MKYVVKKAPLAILSTLAILITSCGSIYDIPQTSTVTLNDSSDLSSSKKSEMLYDQLPQDLKIGPNSGMVEISKESADILEKYQVIPFPQPVDDKQIKSQDQSSFNCYNATSYGNAGTITVQYIGGGYFSYKVNMYNESQYYSITSHLYINGRLISFGGKSDNFYAITGDNVLVVGEADGVLKYAYGSLSCAASNSSNY